MGWTIDKTSTPPVWKCTRYSDLNYAEITNLAEYGTPMSPYEPGFDSEFIPDFANIIIEMPQSEVMTDGYGKDITARSFPFVEKFLEGEISVPNGTYTFDDLVRLKAALKSDRILSGHLYGGGNNGFVSGSISPADAAFIHGTVSVALRPATRFTLSDSARQVDAEIGAMQDNWDFNSKTVPVVVEAVVATAAGADHYNLDGPIVMRYTGPGKRSFAEKQIFDLGRAVKEIGWLMRRAWKPM